ncbi:MAG: DUF3426 domain-containing protein [Gammaproteobacteria bacterium]|nr:DUF3426 domain-containing protein [Gammaproteobacteria bacterium]
MQTICPYCQTVFKVLDEQLSLADGYVRCGICKEVFNALEKPTAEAEKDSSVDSAIADKTNTQNTVAAGDSNPTEPAAHPTTALPDSEKHPEPPGDSAPTSPTAAEPAKEITAAVVDSAQADLFSEASPQTETHSPALSVEISALEAIEPDTVAVTPVSNPDDIQAGTETPTALSTASSKSTPEPTEKTEVTPTSVSDNETEETDLFDGVQSKLIPDEYRIPELHNTTSLWRDIAWSLAILAFTATLFAEYIWFNRNELISDPQLRPLVTQFCAVANCDTMNLREPAKVEMTTRNIYSHPNVKNALMISGTLVNHAHFEQPYPDMLVDFSDVRGEVIASRIFTPEHYMQIKLDSLKLMPPGMPVDFNMEIQDPGNDAMTYEFSFL